MPGSNGIRTAHHQ